MSWQDAYLRELGKLRLRYLPESPFRTLIREDAMQDIHAQTNAPFALCLSTGRIYREHAPPFALPLEGLQTLPEWVRAVAVGQVSVQVRDDARYEVGWRRPGDDVGSLAHRVARTTAGAAWADFIRFCAELPLGTGLSPLLHLAPDPGVIAVHMGTGFLYREGENWKAGGERVCPLDYPHHAPPSHRWMDLRGLQIEAMGDRYVVTREREGGGRERATAPCKTPSDALSLFLDNFPEVLGPRQSRASRFPQWSTVTGRMERPGQLAAEFQGRPLDKSYAQAALDFAREGTRDRTGVVFKHDPDRKYTEVDYAGLEMKLLASLTDLGNERGELRNTPETREAMKERVWEQLYGLVRDRRVTITPPLTHDADLHITLDRNKPARGEKVEYQLLKGREGLEAMAESFGSLTRQIRAVTPIFEGLMDKLNFEAEGWVPDPPAEPPTGPFDPREFAVGRTLSSQAQIGGVHPAFSRAVPSPSEKDPEPVVSVQWSGDQTPQALDRKARLVRAIRDAAAEFPNYQRSDWHPFVRAVDRRVKELRFAGHVGIRPQETDGSSMAVRFEDTLRRDGYRTDFQLRVHGESREDCHRRAFEYLRDLKVG